MKAKGVFESDFDVAEAIANLQTLDDMKRERKLSPYLKDGNGTDEKLEVLKAFLRSGIDPAFPSMNSLSVNGTAVQDDMVTYLSDAGVSSGDLIDVQNTTFHYAWAQTESAQKIEDSRDKKHFELGTYAHSCFLEPHLFELVKTGPENAPLNTTEGVVAQIKFYEGILREAHAKQLITTLPFISYEGYKMAELKGYLESLKAINPFQIIDPVHKLIIECLQRNYWNYAGGILPELLSRALKEVSFYYDCPETRIRQRVRPDGLITEETAGINAIISIKTSRAATLNKFLYDCANLKYHVKEAQYQKVVSKVTGRDFSSTIMIMLQTTPPYLPALFFLDDEDIYIGACECEEALQKILEVQMGKKPVGFEMYAEEGDMGFIKPRFPGWIVNSLHTSSEAQ